MNKREILKRLDKLGVGYCSLKACEENIMGLPVSGIELWKEILDIPIEDLKDMLEYFKCL